MGNQLTVQEETHSKKALASFYDNTSKLEELANACGGVQTAAQIKSAIYMAINKNTDILRCPAQAIHNCAVQILLLGVIPNGRDAHLVPFARSLTMIIDYKGLVQLAWKSGLMETIDANCVYENDEFSYTLGSQPAVSYRKCDGDRGDKVGAYAMARIRGSSWPVVVYLTQAEILKSKKASRSSSSSSSPWQRYEESMWMKTAVRALAKLLPQLPEMNTALMAEDAADSIFSPQQSAHTTAFVDVEPTTIIQQSLNETKFTTDRVEVLAECQTAAEVDRFEEEGMGVLINEDQKTDLAQACAERRFTIGSQ